MNFLETNEFHKEINDFHCHGPPELFPGLPRRVLGISVFVAFISNIIYVFFSIYIYIYIYIILYWLDITCDSAVFRIGLSTTRD